MNLQKALEAIEVLARYLEEIKGSVSFQIVSDASFVRELLMAPSQLSESRRWERDCLARKSHLAAELQDREDMLLGMAYSENRIDGKNLQIRKRQEARVLKEDEVYQELRSALREAEIELREAEAETERLLMEFRVRLAILRDASARLEWLGWLR